jgi:hypothetical protein
MGIADRRGNRIGEIITGIKVIKLNAWEKVMDKMIQAFRGDETNLIQKSFSCPA